MSFSEALQLIKTQRGLTQKEMAHAIGVSVRFYQDLEASKKQPSLETLQNALDGLDIKYEKFFGIRSKSVGEMGPHELEEIVARASKRDGTINLELGRLKKENDDLRSRVSSVPSEFWPVWLDKENERVRAAFLYFLTGEDGYLEGHDIPSVLLKALRRIRKDLA